MQLLFKLAVASAHYDEVIVFVHHLAELERYAAYRAAAHAAAA